MGLDMYLYAEVKALSGSALHQIIETHLTPEQRLDIIDPEEGGLYGTSPRSKRQPPCLVRN